MTPSGTFLTEQELRELTGYAFPRLQIKWLAENRWPFEMALALALAMALAMAELLNKGVSDE